MKKTIPALLLLCLLFCGNLFFRKRDHAELRFRKTECRTDDLFCFISCRFACDDAQSVFQITITNICRHASAGFSSDSAEASVFTSGASISSFGNSSGIASFKDLIATSI